MAQQPLTPEKQLLKLIEGAEPQKSFQGAAVKHRSLSLISFGAWKGRFLFFKKRFKEHSRGRARQLDVKLLNRVLALLVFILAAYFLISLPVSVMNLKNIENVRPVPEASRVQPEKEDTVLKRALTYYLEKARERDIFKMGKIAVPFSGTLPSARILEATKDLKLVGIAWSNNPDAMIEDAAAKKTFFIKRGEMIGGIKVQAIFKDKVVLSYEGEEVELK
ncbi:MAG: hypothetical protein PHE18_05205 [Candidatus Omnitrophica bacterium]|nr:hypothetical protein [Candidatus Omnitrophota bacterium]MDD5553256.1 hypothetical protein [Candidatus Omnitrophota bacterium]